MQDSFGGQNGGKGEITQQKLEKLAESWGTLPEAERAKALNEITRELPPRYKEVIENYFRSLAEGKPGR